MSFMFNPYPYHDKNAVNRLDSEGVDLGQACEGTAESVRAAVQMAAEVIREKGQCVLGVDGYATVPFDVFGNMLEQQFALENIPVMVVEASSLYRQEGDLEAMLAEENLPEDRETDPVLLYGKLFQGRYEDLMDETALENVINTINAFEKDGTGVLLLIGSGVLCKTLRALCDRRIYLDTTPMNAMLRLKRGEYKNIGTQKALPFKRMARRCYYVDFELAAEERLELLSDHAMDAYVIADDALHMTLLPVALLNQIFEKAMGYPLRCKPVYLEGVWGGYFIKRLRHLPEEMKNCAWVFDMIPMEVSIVFDFNSRRFEFPFYTLVQSQALKLMGRESVERFGPYFPVRFNYDDTIHASGNMSIQCHPGEDYVKENNGELGRQDESYYIVEAGQGAKTYLGFRDDADVEAFIADARRSEQEGTPVDYKKYIHAVASVPGTQVMIPAGTIHASGRNQLILEIGSLTVGSYTYKMYDYLRKDFDGKPRPIHTHHGDKVLARDRKAAWVDQNLVNGGSRSVRSGEDWEEAVVGEHELLYFSLRTLKFVDKISEDTKGRFHVLTLVDGEQVMVRSKAHPERFFTQNYLDIVVVPAAFGEYEIINLKPGTTAIEHKTMLK